MEDQVTEDPFRLECMDRTDEQLWEFLVFSVCVAGKSAAVTQDKVNQFIRSITNDRRLSLYDAFREEKREGIFHHLRQCRMGQYNRIATALWELYRRAWPFSLRNITPTLLERVPGIGPKTARFFVMYTQPNVQVAVLDTHILRWLRRFRRTFGLVEVDVPDTTPQNSATYSHLETLYLEAAGLLDIHPRHLDTAIWRSHAKN